MCKARLYFEAATLGLVNILLIFSLFKCDLILLLIYKLF